MAFRAAFYNTQPRFLLICPAVLKQIEHVVFIFSVCCFFSARFFIVLGVGEREGKSHMHGAF
jgi:hypothetical protein